jgi:hypothetical protein
MGAPQTRGRRRGIAGVGAAARATAAVVVAVLAFAGSGAGSSHELDRSVRIGTAVQRANELLLAGTETGAPTGDGAVTLDLSTQPVRAFASAKSLRRAHWFCFPVTQEQLIHCAPPGYLQRNEPDVPLVVFDREGTTFLGTEDLIRNDVYDGKKCPFEGGGRYHATPKGYVACHEFSLPAAFRLGYRGTAEQPRRGGWFCFPVTAERLIHCAPPGYLQRNAPDVPLVVFDASGSTFLGTEDLIRNDVYRNQKCPFEGGNPFHPTPKGYVACHEFPLSLAAAAAAMKFTGLVVDRFEDGSMTSFVEGRAKVGAGGSTSYTGTGTFTTGTKSYAGVKGRYRLRGTVGPRGNGAFTLEGDVDY